MSEPLTPAAPDAEAPLCPICQTALGPDEAATACPECGTAYHAECWEENGGCAVYGCSQVPPTDARKELEVPPSYWGQERKACPVCLREIMAAAVRCRHCGATFSSARPETTEQFAQRRATAGKLPETARDVVIVFILCLLSCTAPLGAAVGLLCRHRRRTELKTLPAVYTALLKIGIGVGLAQSVLLVVVTVLFAVFRSA